MGAGQAGVGTSSREQTDRFASFAERYVIERASSFRPGNEKQDAWLALQDAQRIYDMIQRGVVVRNAGLAAQFVAGDAAIGPQAGAPQSSFGSMCVKDLMAIVADCQAKGRPIPYGVNETLRRIFGHLGKKGHNNGPTI